MGVDQGLLNRRDFDNLIAGDGGPVAQRFVEPYVTMNVLSGPLPPDIFVEAMSSRPRVNPTRTGRFEMSDVLERASKPQPAV